MGCDIHYFLERYTSEPDTSNGPKDISTYREERINSIVDGSIVDPRWISADMWEYHKSDNYWNCHNIYCDRNYWLFHFLADVRNGPKRPLDYPRGVPEDASDSYNYIVDQWKGDGHSHSYFTLSELLAVPDETWDELEASDFRNVLAKMQSIDSDPDNVRACFFFDN